MKPDLLLQQYMNLLTEKKPDGPILDLACGDGHNGTFLASKGLPVILADVSEASLLKAEHSARIIDAPVTIWRVDLEQDGVNPFAADSYAAVIVFRYLHRPLIPCIKKALKEGGILVYETFTTAQTEFGKPRNPDHLLKTGELREWFRDWDGVHYFEGIAENPMRSIAQIVCRKPIK